MSVRLNARLVGRIGASEWVEQSVADAVTVGSGAENDLRIKSSGLSNRHARIVKRGPEYYLEDLGSRTGTFLNGQRISKFPIRNLDVVTLGPGIDLVFVAAAPDAGPPRPAVLHGSITWLDGPLAGKVETIPRDSALVIGRTAPLESLSELSRRHAAFSLRGGRLTVEDLGSANGTWVKGEPIAAVTALENGEEVILGGLVRVRVQVAESPAGTAEPKAAAAPVHTVPAPPAVSHADHVPTTMAPREAAVAPPPAGFTFGIPAQPAAAMPGPLAARARAAREAAAAPPADPLTAVALEGPTRVVLNIGIHEVGRNPDCALVIDSRDISRRHARLHVHADAVQIEDLQTANGTFVDDIAVIGMADVPDRSRVRFATIEFAVVYVRSPRDHV